MSCLPLDPLPAVRTHNLSFPTHFNGSAFQGVLSLSYDFFTLDCSCTATYAPHQCIYSVVPKNQHTLVLLFVRWSHLLPLRSEIDFKHIQSDFIEIIYLFP